jgi:adenylate cyclase
LLDIGRRPGDEPDLVVRKRTTVAVALATVVAASVYMSFGIGTDRPFLTLFSSAQAAAQLALLYYFARTGRLRVVVVLMIVVGLLVIASGVVTLGGIRQANGNVVAALLVPMGAVLLLGRRAALPAYAGFAALVLWAALSDPLWRDSPLPISAELALGLYAMNMLFAGALSLALVVFIDGERLWAKAQSESLLLNVLPRAIVHRLQEGEQVIADHHPDVTVLFSDVVDFTPFSERVPPGRVVEVLNELFSAFDALAEWYRLEKIKTIGDAYMVVAGVPEPRPDHAQVMLEMAVAMHAIAAEQPEIDGHRLQLRSGIATGPVVAGVIGSRKFSYDLWGDTVNIASRMESSGVPGCIQVTQASWSRLKGGYPWQVREGVEVKGKGPMRTFLLDPTTLPRDQQVQPVSRAHPSQQ